MALNRNWGKTGMCTDSEEHPGTRPEPAMEQAADNSTPAPAANASLIADLVTANHILFDHGVVDAFGHVSVRHDKVADRFLLARNLAPALVTPDDILEFDLDGNPLAAAGRSVYLERFIHGEIYRARPDVMAVVHSHAPAVVPFGAVAAQPLKPIWHMSGFLGAGVPIFEIRDTAGPGSDLLIRSSKLGAALAASLASASVVLMRGHGATVVGSDLKQAVFRAVYTQMNAELQLQAKILGAATFLTAQEAAATTIAVGGQIDRAWAMWARQAD
jgi:HCOMODA/2-hydroxy-3-carboxy-muconic semialdehyde decarboxylase